MHALPQRHRLPPCMQAGQYIDAGAASGEVLADLDLQQSRLAQLAAQAQELGAVQQELGGAAAAAAAAAGADGSGFPEIKDAEAAVQVRLDVMPVCQGARVPACNRCSCMEPGESP